MFQGRSRRVCGASSKPIGQLVDKPIVRGNILHILHAAVQYAHTADRTATAWKHLLVPDEEVLALLAKAREEHAKGSLFESNGPDLDNVICTRTRCGMALAVQEAEEEEAPAEPSLLAADVKEPVALAPEQALKPAQRMCKFLALRLAFLEIRVLPICTKLHCQEARAPALLQNGSP